MNDEVILSQYGDVIDIAYGDGSYVITNATGKQWTLTDDDIANDRKGTPRPRYLVVWQTKGGEMKWFPHTSKPTALGHVRGLRRHPQMEAVAIYPISEDTDTQ